ncbi:hypothetical protein K438DRAFT_1939216 [Mycena galopus ATCC 62051]|nr:hypothetical protein K438DRAFT_1939216 [Mycena galopus ATCC 62051]
MAYAAAHFLLPAMQNALIDPAKWNSDWENLTNRLQHISPAQFVQTAAFLLGAETDGMDASLLEYQGLLGSLAGVQLSLTKEVTCDLGENMETDWMNASPALREKHILIGLSNACSIARNLHDARIHCGRDFRLSRLRGDGRIVFDWLKAVMIPQDPEKALELLNKPRYVPDAAWDALTDLQQRSAPNDSEKLALGNILVLRTKLICLFLQSTLRSFVGKDAKLDIWVVKNKKKIVSSFPSQAVDRSAMEQILGPAGAKAAAKEGKAAWKERQSARRECCSYVGCGKPNNGTEKYPRCKRCWEGMQREVLYCSTECQKADWKSNHKAICGKSVSFDAVSKPKLTHDRKPDKMPHIPSALVIGPPTGSYKRSSALVAQINWLNKFPKVDYILTGSSPECFMDFPDPAAQTLFRKCREKAMNTGDRQSIAIMAHFLCWMAIDHKNTIENGATPDVIVGQLQKEYLFDELHLAVTEMQQRQNRDPLKRPVLLSGMSPENWMKFSSGMNVHRQVVLS